MNESKVMFGLTPKKVKVGGGSGSLIGANNVKFFLSTKEKDMLWKKTVKRVSSRFAGGGAEIVAYLVERSLDELVAFGDSIPEVQPKRSKAKKAVGVKEGGSA